MKTNILLSFVAIGAAISLQAAEFNEPGTYLTRESAPADFKLQGEYANDWGGSQVIALGDERFRLVTYPGGLPGDGWDRSERNPVAGKLEDGKVVFTGDNGYRAEAADGTLTIWTADGGPWTMPKIERKSPTLGAKPPEGAVVLFDGSGTDKWQNPHTDGRGLLAAGTKTKDSFGDFTLHAEFILPFKPKGRGQDRGNSGVYLQDRYEVQVLDSFGLEGRNNECGGFYSKKAPDVNMCFPPLTWQTYDIDFAAARFDESGKKTQNAVVTVKHNGVVIHDKVEIDGPTGGGKREDSSGGAIQLQGHGNPVFYRNIWIAPK